MSKAKAPDVGLSDTWPPVYTRPNWKTSRTATKKKKVAAKKDLDAKEDQHKRTAKKRDGHRCRFPLCGCRKLGLALEARLESSHHVHKGMGGDPTGERSLPWLLVTLCKHRHQDGAVSIHKGTLRPRFLTSRAYDGIIAWQIDLDLLKHRREGSRPCGVAQWFEVARETAVGQWAPFTERQLAILEHLAEMDL